MSADRVIPDYKLKEGGELPLCQHGDVPTMRVSRCGKNPVRPCLACRRKDSCRDFHWADEEAYRAIHQQGQRYESNVQERPR